MTGNPKSNKSDTTTKPRPDKLVPYRVLSEASYKARKRNGKVYW